MFVKPPEQSNVLNLPIMIIVQGLDETRDYLRVSIRSGGSGDIARNYLNLINLYMG